MGCVVDLCTNNLIVGTTVVFQPDFDPDAINWGAVGSLNSVAADLRKITDFLFGEGEHAA